MARSANKTSAAHHHQTQKKRMVTSRIEHILDLVYDIQDTEKDQAQRIFKETGNMMTSAFVNIGKLDSVIYELGGKSSNDRWPKQFFDGMQ